MPGSNEQQLTVPEGTRAGRADKLLAQLYPDLSRSRWQKLFQAGRVWQEDRVLSQKTRLQAGDVVEFSIPPVESLELRPVAMDLSILFEDEHLLIIDKAPGVVVHPGAGTGEDTLVHGILHHCQGNLPGIGGKERPGIVHRLDKETSGLIVVARTDAAFQGLAEQFSERRIKKFYTALVRGVPNGREGTVEEPIGRHPVHRVRMSCRKDGRPARTDYRVLDKWTHCSLLRLQIHTGRTHQIRVHMKHLGHPLLGDSLYGYKPLPGVPEAPRVMLHATRLVFTHPVEQREVEFEAVLPADFTSILEQLDASESR